MENVQNDSSIKINGQSTRLYIFVGAYGSGKSEVSVHFARKLRRENPDRKVLLADLDIVNPFFRSADARDILEAENIRVIAPNDVNSNVESQTIPGEIYTIFDDKDYLGVFDIGGEDMGARILSFLHNRFPDISFQVYMVVNTRRPFTADAKSIAEMAAELSAAARLPISGLIDNTNLLTESEPDELTVSYPILQEASMLTGIPVVYASGLDECLPTEWIEYTGNGIPLLRMERTVLYNNK